MNFLAHLHLAHPDPQLMWGGLLGDFVKGSADALAAPVRRGVYLHRAIDSFTDAHPLVLATKPLFAPPYRRFAGILVDLAFDHCLARSWDDWNSTPLRAFCDQAYRLIRQQLAKKSLPPRMEGAMQYLLGRDLLYQYQHFAEIERSLSGISNRLSRANPLANAGPVLLEKMPEIERCFRLFYPELLQQVQRWKVENPQ